MADKLEVLPGQGMVARFGQVAVWAGPQCSQALLAHLVTEVQRAAQVPNGGEQVANSLISVLQRGDPEPQAPFAIVGPSQGGLTLLLHGPVQAWDSGRWLAPQPVPGWMTAPVARPWPLIVLPYGANPPPQSQQGNPFDLLAGVVPGSGFVMLRPPSAPGPSTGGVATASGAPTPVTSHSNQGGPSTSSTGSLAGGPGPAGGLFGASATPSEPHQPAGAQPTTAQPTTAQPTTAQPTTAQGGSTGGSGTQVSTGGATGFGAVTPSSSQGTLTGQSPAQASPTPAQAGAFQAGPTSFGPQAPAPGATPGPSTLDLRNVFVPGSPPLPTASNPGRSFDRPEAPGVYCERGHFNHPGSSRCARCARAIPPGSQAASGPRPPVGVLLADDGSIWALDRTYLIGADPGSAGEVRMGSARAIAMRSGANHTMAPVQAEIKVSGWSVYLVDRGAEGGTYWQGPQGSGWVQLGRSEQRELTDGSHVSCGGRVLTYLSAWSSSSQGVPAG